MFPNQFPQAQMSRLVAELLGQGSEPTARLVEDAYDVLGYGLYLAFGSGEQMPLAACPMPETCEEKAQVLQRALHPQATAIPWSVILPIVMELLRKWLAGEPLHSHEEVKKEFGGEPHDCDDDEQLDDTI